MMIPLIPAIILSAVALTTNLQWRAISGTGQQPVLQESNAVIVTEEAIGTAEAIKLPINLSLTLTPQKQGGPYTFLRISIPPLNAPNDTTPSRSLLYMDLNNNPNGSFSIVVQGLQIINKAFEKRPLKLGKECRLAISLRQGRLRLTLNGDSVNYPLKVKLPDACYFQFVTSDPGTRWRVVSELERPEP